MKKSLNEAKRLQRLAGLNENLFSPDGGSEVPSNPPKKSNTNSPKTNNGDSQNKIDSVGELSKQFNNIRALLSKGDVNDLSTNEIKQISEIIQLLINIVQKGEVAAKLKKSKEYLDNLTKQ